MPRVLLLIVLIMSGCSSASHEKYSATTIKHREGGDFLDQIQEGANSLINGGTKQNGMLLVNLSAQYNKRNGKWPESVDDLIYIDGSGKKQKVFAKDVRFTPKGEDDLMIQYTNSRGATDGIILTKAKSGKAYAFCFMVDPNSECDSFVAVSMRN